MHPFKLINLLKEDIKENGSPHFLFFENINGLHLEV